MDSPKAYFDDKLLGLVRSKTEYRSDPDYPMSVDLTVTMYELEKVTGLLGKRGKLTIDRHTILDNCECIAEPDDYSTKYIVTLHYKFIECEEALEARVKALEARVKALEEQKPEDLDYKGFKVRPSDDGYVVTIQGETLFEADKIDLMHRLIDRFYKGAKWNQLNDDTKVCRWNSWIFVWSRNTLDAFYLKDTAFCWPSDVLPDIVKEFGI